MSTELTPKEIQARIRSGASAQQVADETSMPLDRIQAFAGPVLAERAYMAQQAQRTTVRRKHVPGNAEQLSVLAEAGLTQLGADPGAATWDAARRNDGLWEITLTSHALAARTSFLFDAASRYVRPADEAAHQLVGDVALPNTPDMALADVISEAAPQTISGSQANKAGNPAEPVDPAEDEQASQAAVDAELVREDRSDAASKSNPNRTSMLNTDELELDLGLGPFDAGPDDSTLRNISSVASLKEARDRRAQSALGQRATNVSSESSERADPADVGPVSASPTPKHRRSAADGTDDHEPDLSDQDTQSEIESTRSKKRHERRRVPSWDEIMFGGKER